MKEPEQTKSDYEKFINGELSIEDLEIAVGGMYETKHHGIVIAVNNTAGRSRRYDGGPFYRCCYIIDDGEYDTISLSEFGKRVG